MNSLPQLLPPTSKVLFSCFNLYKGGSLALYKRIEHVLDNDYRFYCLASKSMLAKAANSHKALAIDYPKKTGLFNLLYRFLVEQLLVVVAGLLLRADHLVMMGNFPCYLWPKAQSVFFHNTLYLKRLRMASSLKERMERVLFRTLVVRKKTKYIVQTRLTRDLLLSEFPCLSVSVAGHPKCSNNHNHLVEQSSVMMPLLEGKHFVVYPAYFYPHKRHDLLLEVESTLLELGIKVILTIDPCDPPFHSSSLDDDSTPFSCVGALSLVEMHAVYNSADGMIFLSESESLGIPLLEACEHRLPVIAPNRPYVQSIISNFYQYTPHGQYSLDRALRRFSADLLSQKCLLPTTESLVDPLTFVETLIQ